MNLETALVHEVCPICCAKTNEQILLNQQLTKKAAAQVKEMHGKAIGYSEPCKECQSRIDNGFVALIAIDPSKSNTTEGTVSFNDIYRTGKLAWLKRNVAKESFNWDRPEPFILVEDGVIDILQGKLNANESD